MNRSAASLGLLCVAVFLVLSPLVLHKPGWPAGLKADEPAYYLMALSLARDGDLRCDLEDLRRLFDEFPYSPADNLILATDDDWQTVYYGKPYVYSLFAAPTAGLFGASGVVAFNMLLMVAMVWMGTRYLRRYNPGGVATLFAAGFFLLSAGSAYVFWLHPEVFNMTSVMACLYFGLDAAERDRDGRRRLWGHPLTRLFASGAVLMPAAYNKPMLAILGLPVLFALARRRRGRAAGAWIAGALASAAAIAGLSLTLTGHPSAYLGMARGGQKVCSPHEIPISPAFRAMTVSDAGEGGELSHSPLGLPADSPSEPTFAPPRGSWYWLFRIPRLHPREVAENLGYFLWGRHTGLLLYFPFAALAVVLFALHGRRSATRWAVLASLGMVALIFLLWIPRNWHGGGGFVGNRYFVNAYPAFLFLVTRISLARVHLLLGYALGGMLLGPMLFTPMGRSVPWPTLQAHVRNFPFPHFPLELSLREVPGYERQTISGVRAIARRDQFLPRGASFWIHGATTTEIWLQSETPLDTLHFQLASPAIPNEVVLRLGSEERRLVFEDSPADLRAVALPAHPTKVRSVWGTPVYAYRLEVSPRTGEVRTWTQNYPPQECPDFPENLAVEESFYVGAELTFLGPAERLGRELYDVRWRSYGGPRRIAAGEVFEAAVEVENASGATWPADPPTRVGLSYRWQDAGGRQVTAGDPHAGEPRTYVEAEVEPGTRVVLRPRIAAPEVPGSYVLVFDLVYELVAWFSSKNGGDVYRLPIEVTATPTESPSQNSPTVR